MSSPVSSADHTPRLEVESSDASCTSCWGRKIKKKEKPTPAPLVRGYIMSKSARNLDELANSLANPAKDSSEVYQFTKRVDVQGIEMPPKHIRQPTRYPKKDIDADSTQSTEEAKQ